MPALNRFAKACERGAEPFLRVSRQSNAHARRWAARDVRVWRARVELPTDIVNVLRVGYSEDARELARDFPELDLELWTTLAAA